MADSPDIAVMMMTYNNETDIQQALDSLATQTYKNFHLILVDDCSVDQSFDIALKYYDKFSNVTMFRNDKNKGVIGNLYDTLRLVEKVAPQAAFFIWAGSDDWWEPTFLEKARDRLLSDPNASVCQAWFDTFHTSTQSTTLHKLCSVYGVSYRDAKKIFKAHNSDVDPTPFNFTLHGLMRMSVMRDIYPDNSRKIAYSAATELSGLVSMVLRGGIIILPEFLVHRRNSGRFADKNPQDSLSQYYKNSPLRMWATLSCLPRLLKMRRKGSPPFLVLLLWLQLFKFYGVAPGYVALRTLIKGRISAGSLTRNVPIILIITTGVTL